VRYGDLSNQQLYNLQRLAKHGEVWSDITQFMRDVFEFDNNKEFKKAVEECNESAVWEYMTKVRNEISRILDDHYPKDVVDDKLMGPEKDKVQEKELSDWKDAKQKASKKGRDDFDKYRAEEFPKKLKESGAKKPAERKEEKW
jgi:hypothetical protein